MQSSQGKQHSMVPVVLGVGRGSIYTLLLFALEVCNTPASHCIELGE